MGFFSNILEKLGMKEAAAAPVITPPAAVAPAAPAPVAVAAAPAEPVVQPIAMVDVMTLLAEKAAEEVDVLGDGEGRVEIAAESLWHVGDARRHSAAMRDGAHVVAEHPDVEALPHGRSLASTLAVRVQAHLHGEHRPMTRPDLDDGGATTSQQEEPR